MLLEVFQAGVENLLNSVHLRPQHFALFPLFHETLVHSLFKIAQPLIVDEETDKDRQGWQSGADSRDYQLSKGSHILALADRTTHSPDHVFRNRPFVVTIEHVHHANFLHRHRR